MVNVTALPVQVPDTGIMLIVAVTGILLVLTAVNGMIFPLPLAGKPIEMLLFVQLKFVLLSVPEKLIKLVPAPLHKTRFGGCTTLGVGLTVMVNVCAAPGQPAADGVTVIVAVTGAEPVLIAANAGIFPLPDAAKPIDVLLFVQLKVLPPTAPEKVIRLVVAPLHII